jgi:protein CpxP
MRVLRWLLPMFVIALLEGATSAQAQLRPRRNASPPRADMSRQLPSEQGGDRVQLERQFQRLLYQVTRRRVGLSDEQMKQLVPVNRRFEAQRRSIQKQERETRLSLRDAMRDSTQADQSRITGYLDRLVQLQHQRVDLIEQEQRDLAQFMTPLQRARYTALQEQVRHRVEQRRRQNGVNADTSALRPPSP